MATGRQRRRSASRLGVDRRRQLLPAAAGCPGSGKGHGDRAVWSIRRLRFPTSRCGGRPRRPLARSSPLRPAALRRRASDGRSRCVAHGRRRSHCANRRCLAGGPSCARSSPARQAAAAERQARGSAGGYVARLGTRHLGDNGAGRTLQPIERHTRARPPRPWPPRPADASAAHRRESKRPPR